MYARTHAHACTQILCWGVRDMKRYQLLPVLHPYIRVECDGAVEPKETLMIKDASRNPNFPGKQPRIVIDKVLYNGFM